MANIVDRRIEGTVMKHKPLDLSNWGWEELLEDLDYQRAEGKHTRSQCKCGSYSRRGATPCIECIIYEMNRRDGKLK